MKNLTLVLSLFLPLFQSCKKDDESKLTSTAEMYNFSRVGGYHTRRPAFLRLDGNNLYISSFDVPKPGSRDNLLNYVTKCLAPQMTQFALLRI